MKNKEIKEILQILDGISKGYWTHILPKEAKLLLLYIEQLENNNINASSNVFLGGEKK